MRVVSAQRFANPVVVEKHSRPPGIFREDNVSVAQGVEGTKGDVIEVPDGRGNDTQLAVWGGLAHYDS